MAPPSGASRPRLTFIGTGYLGATYAICFAELGYEVLGVDIDSDKIAKLSSGEVPFHEPGLDELLRANLAAGRLRFATSYEQAAEFGDVHFICVGTPQRNDGMSADLSYVEQAVIGLAQALTRKALIVGKSTVPAGTAEWVQQLVTKHSDPSLEIEVAWSPEFLQEGHAVEDVLRPNRLVLAYRSHWAGAMLYAAHKGVFDLAATEDREVPVVTCDFATAELVKVAANSFLATKISFINAMAEVCEAVGADVTLLAKALGYDPRIGHRYLQAGIGFGGGCLPKDIRAFQARAGGARGWRGTAVPARGRSDQHAPPHPGAQARRGATRPAVRPGRPRPVRGPHRRARRHLQTQHRRRSRRAVAGRGLDAPQGGRRRPRLRPAGHGQRPRRPATGDLRRVDERRGRRLRTHLRPHRVVGVPQRRPEGVGRTRRPEDRHRRSELPRRGGVDRRRLAVPRHGSRRLVHPAPGTALRLPA